MMRTIASALAIAVLLVLGAAWLIGSSTRGTAVAPLRDDATIRARTIAFEELRVRHDPLDQITPRMLSDAYLQRYRETGDLDDVVRAQAMAERSLRIAPRGNGAATMSLAAALFTLHRFGQARALIRSARALRDAPELATLEASLDLEIGDRSSAEVLIARFARAPSDAALLARLDELTGHLARARARISAATQRADAQYGMPNERRAWYYVRSGELAFAAGDIDGALALERRALERFPSDAAANTDSARFAAAAGRWAQARTAAERATAAVPSPENLGLLADAQRALGDPHAAAATEDEIRAIERIGNRYHVVDRLLALYYADHGFRLDDAYAIAARDLRVRHDPFTWDALAWTAARSGRWQQAQRAAQHAVAWNTADVRIWRHAALIADHFGQHADADAAREHIGTLGAN